LISRYRQKCVIGLLRLFLPLHVDNEQAADCLRSKVGQNDPRIKWASVRPDGLIDEPDVTEFDVHPSPTRSAIFDAGQTSRINVACFMSTLVNDDGNWQVWRGRMPVI
jgi:hypothetical protein